MRYFNELSTLNTLGFIDIEANVNALRDARGDLNRAVNDLLGD